MVLLTDAGWVCPTLGYTALGNGGKSRYIAVAEAEQSFRN